MWVFPVSARLAMASATPNQDKSLDDFASEAAVLKLRGTSSVQVQQASFLQSLASHPLWVKDLFMHILGAQHEIFPDTE